MSEPVQHPVFDMEIMRGADETFTFIYTDDDGAVIALTDYTAKMQVRDRAGGKLFLTLTDTDGISISDAYGEVQVDFTHAQTLAMDIVNAHYDLWIVSPGSVYTCIARGRFSILESVTEW